MNFAYMEAQIALGMIFRKYSFSLYGDEKVFSSLLKKKKSLKRERKMKGELKKRRKKIRERELVINIIFFP